MVEVDLDGLRKLASIAMRNGTTEAYMAASLTWAAGAEREIRRLRELAVPELCDMGHRFMKMADHPTRDGRARCPHCLAIGFDKLRDEGL